MAVNRMSFEDASVTSLGAVMGSAGPIGNVVSAASAQPDMAVQGPVNAPTPRGMA